MTDLAAYSTGSSPAGGTGRWLAGRLSEAPPELGRAVRGLLEDVAIAEMTPNLMIVCAVDAFERVAQTSQTRAAALELLAADALLTYAFEAAVSPNLGGSAEVASALAGAAGPRGELGRRMGPEDETPHG